MSFANDDIIMEASHIPLILSQGKLNSTIKIKRKRECEEIDDKLTIDPNQTPSNQRGKRELTQQDVTNLCQAIINNHNGELIIAKSLVTLSKQFLGYNSDSHLRLCCQLRSELLCERLIELLTFSDVRNHVDQRSLRSYLTCSQDCGHKALVLLNNVIACGAPLDFQYIMELNVIPILLKKMTTNSDELFILELIRTLDNICMDFGEYHSSMLSLGIFSELSQAPLWKHKYTPLAVSQLVLHLTACAPTLNTVCTSNHFNDLSVVFKRLLNCDFPGHSRQTARMNIMSAVERVAHVRVGIGPQTVFGGSLTEDLIKIIDSHAHGRDVSVVALDALSHCNVDHLLDVGVLPLLSTVLNDCKYKVGEAAIRLLAHICTQSQHGLQRVLDADLLVVMMSKFHTFTPELSFLGTSVIARAIMIATKVQIRDLLREGYVHWAVEILSVQFVDARKNLVLEQADALMEDSKLLSLVLQTFVRIFVMCSSDEQSLRVASSIERNSGWLIMDKIFDQTSDETLQQLLSAVFDFRLTRLD